jgi:DNA-binding NarL/FixJ family response regulator
VFEAAAALVGDGVVVLDLHLGDGRRSTSMIGPLREHGMCVLVLTAEQNPVLLAECLEAGADGIFNKAQSFDGLVEMLYDAVDGHSIISVSAREELLAVLRNDRRDRHRRGSAFAQLTNREGDVLRGLVAGRSTEEIATDMGVALSTVRSHVKTLLRKLGVNSQLAAVALARAAEWGADVVQTYEPN